MAQMYGPMTYRPNPAGLTLNSRPGQPQGGYVPPPATPAAAVAAKAPTFAEWMKTDGRRSQREHFMNAFLGNVSRGQMNSPGYSPFGSEQMLRNKYYDTLIAGGQFPMGAGGGGVAGPLALDSSAANYANFLNNRG